MSTQQRTVDAILLCAGAGARLGGGVEKSLVSLAGRPLFAWSLDALARCTAVEAIVVVGPAGKLEAMQAGGGRASPKVAA